MKNKKILVIDDNLNNRFTAEAILDDNDVEDVDIVEGGEQAIALVKEVKYDIILLDIEMSPMDGYTTLKEIKSLANGKNVPIISWTASIVDDHVEALKKKGFDDFIPKPTDQDFFEKIVNKWVP